MGRISTFVVALIGVWAILGAGIVIGRQTVENDQSAAVAAPSQATATVAVGPSSTPTMVPTLWPTATQVPPTQAPKSIHGIDGVVHIWGRLTGSEISEIRLTGNSQCEGADGYDDIHAGAKIVIKDGDGRTITVGKLDQGMVDDAGANADMSASLQCSFPFVVPNVPDADFYAVIVAGRDGPTYSFAEMEETAWTLGLSLGA